MAEPSPQVPLSFALALWLPLVAVALWGVYRVVAGRWLNDDPQGESLPDPWQGAVEHDVRALDGVDPPAGGLAAQDPAVTGGALDARAEEDRPARLS